MKNLDGAKCVGHFSLFDSQVNADHVEARKLCETCPVILACHSLLVEVMAECSAGPAGAPVGTWASRLYKQGRRVRVPRNYERAVS